MNWLIQEYTVKLTSELVGSRSELIHKPTGRFMNGGYSWTNRNTYLLNRNCNGNLGEMPCKFGLRRGIISFLLCTLPMWRVEVIHLSKILGPTNAGSVQSTLCDRCPR